MHITVEQIPVEVDLGPLVTRGVDCGAVYTRHITLPPGTDMRPLLRGLPGDSCPCPHWGQVLEGSITIQYDDGTMETCRAGDVYSWPAGHVGWTDEGAVFLEMSPTTEILPVLAHLGPQLVPAQ